MNTVRKTAGLKELFYGLAVWTPICAVAILMLSFIGAPLVLSVWGIWFVWMTSIAVMASDLGKPY